MPETNPPNIERNRPEVITKEEIERIDKVVESPEHRAARVLEAISQLGFTQWDVCCFCVNYLTTLVPQLPSLEWLIRKLATAFYYSHYSEYQGVYLGDSKPAGQDPLFTGSTGVVIEGGIREGSTNNPKDNTLRNPTANTEHIKIIRDKPV